MVVHRNLSATLIEELYTFTDAMSRCPRCAEAEAPTFRPGLRVRLRCKGANQNNAPGTKNEWHSIAPCPCPLWVKSRHVQCKTACPLTPESDHKCHKWACPLRAHNGHLSAQAQFRFGSTSGARTIVRVPYKLIASL